MLENIDVKFTIIGAIIGALFCASSSVYKIHFVFIPFAF